VEPCVKRIKFTPSGGKVQVRLERINSHLEIVVADTGPGNRQERARKCFRIVSGRLPALTVQSAEWAWVCRFVRHIVHLHGGTVIARSDGLGKGSVFTIRLPLPVTTANVETTERRHPTVASKRQFARIPRLDKISALIVDDDPEAREALRSLLDLASARGSRPREPARAPSPSSMT